MKHGTILRLTALSAAFLLLVGCNKINLTSGEADGQESADSLNISSSRGDAEDIEVVITPNVVNYDDSFVGCDAAICYDKTENRIVYSKNPDGRVYPASTTKLLTALTALNYVKPDFVFVTGSELDFVELDSSRAWLVEGDSLKRDAMLAALLTPSGNDAAYTIAVNVSRKLYGNDLTDRAAVDRFVALMNDCALSLGTTATHFSAPDGYHDDDHYTTARDMLKIAIAASNNDVITGITSQQITVVYDEAGEVHSWQNGNHLLYDEDSPYTALGLKTGFTDEAGFCFIGYAEMEGREIITLTFNCDENNRYRDTRKLMDIGFGIYDPDKYIEKDDESEDSSDRFEQDGNTYYY